MDSFKDIKVGDTVCVRYPHTIMLTVTSVDEVFFHAIGPAEHRFVFFKADGRMRSPWIPGERCTKPTQEMWEQAQKDKAVQQLRVCEYESLPLTVLNDLLQRIAVYEKQRGGAALGYKVTGTINVKKEDMP